MINDYGFNWPFEIKGYLSKSIFIADNDILDLMSFEIGIVEDCIHFHLSDSILTS
jgi:hypothetical protein